MSKTIGKYQTTTANYLGSGSLGRVEKAKDTEKNIDVVLKSIPKSILKDDENIQLQLLDEIRMFQKLKNPNIVELLDVFQSENTYYMVLECCQQNLSQYLKKEKMSEKDAIKMLNDILQGFTELNKHGIIHRGVKLTNIMVTDGVFKLADCGLTKCLESFRKEQQPLQHFQYLSPQIINGQKFSSKCDIWSLGIVLYQVLYGYQPWFAKSVEEYQKQLQLTLLEFPETKEKISNEMKSFIEGCLQIDEEERFDWDKVYKHKLVSEHFKDYRSQIKQDQIKFLMNEVRQKIIKQNIDVIKLFNELDINGDKTLEFKELVVLLRKIDKTLSNNECQIIFKQLDLDGDKTISFDEFAKWLTDNNTKMTLLTKKFHRQSTIKLSNNMGASPIVPQQNPQNPQQANKINTNLHNNNNVQQFGNYPNAPQGHSFDTIPNPMQTLDDEDINPFEDICNQRSPEQTILMLKDIINRYGINLYDFFLSYDQNKDGYISFQEFYSLSKQLNPSFTNEELRIAFKIFDLNDDNFIQYNEFKEILSITVQRPQKTIYPLNNSAPFFGQNQYQQPYQQTQQKPQPQNFNQTLQNPAYQQQQQQYPYQVPQQQYQNTLQDQNLAYQLMNY